MAFIYYKVHKVTVKYNLEGIISTKLYKPLEIVFSVVWSKFLSNIPGQFILGNVKH